MSKPTFKDFIINSKKATPIPITRSRDDEDDEEISEPGRSGSKKKFSKKNILVGLALFTAVIILFFGLSSMFSSATVRVVPISERVSLDDVFTASNTVVVGENNLPFKIMKIEDSETALVPAGKTEKVTKKASGTIIVYNNYSESAQKLVTGTRFETTDGKIYKIDKSISVPGKKVVNGKVVPGSLTVTVYAANPGAEYNIGPSDFTLPGLVGSPRFKEVFAKGKGDITGGFVGEMKIVSPEDITAARKTLDVSLTKKLAEKAILEVPAGYILYNDAISVELKDNSADIGTKAEGDKVTLVLKGTLRSVIFDSAALAAAVAERKLPDLKNYDVRSDELAKVVMKMIGKSGMSFDEKETFAFKLTGAPKIVWNMDTEAFKKDLAGLPKSSYQEVFKKYPMILKAETTFVPSWSSVFPSDSSKINIELAEE